MAAHGSLHEPHDDRRGRRVRFAGGFPPLPAHDRGTVPRVPEIPVPRAPGCRHRGLGAGRGFRSRSARRSRKTAGAWRPGGARGAGLGSRERRPRPRSSHLAIPLCRAVPGRKRGDPSNPPLLRRRHGDDPRVPDAHRFRGKILPPDRPGRRPPLPLRRRTRAKPRRGSVDSPFRARVSCARHTRKGPHSSRARSISRRTPSRRPNLRAMRSASQANSPESRHSRTTLRHDSRDPSAHARSRPGPIRSRSRK